MSVVLSDDLLAETESYSASLRFCGKERNEDLLTYFFRDAGTIVFYFYQQTVCLLQAEDDSAFRLSFESLHRILQ